MYRKKLVYNIVQCNKVQGVTLGKKGPESVSIAKSKQEGYRINKKVDVREA